MNKAAWLTDIHLNFLNANQREQFYQKILDANVDCVFISGDIAEARGYKGSPKTQAMLQEMYDILVMPIYFILGNHDYYFGNIAKIRSEIHGHGFIKYLTIDGPVALNEETVLFGVDGFADTRAGNYANSRMKLNDSILIEELAADQSHEGLKATMLKLADADTEHLIDEMDFYLNEAVRTSIQKIIILTHVPPFKEACLYKRAMSGDEALPFYCNLGLGEALLKFTSEHPHIDFTVLCGHTHSEATYEATDNLIVLCGEARYYEPSISKIIEF